MKVYFTLMLLSAIFILNAQEKAITESGDTIYVFNDGTWTYDPDVDFKEQNASEILEISFEDIKIDSSFRILKSTQNSDKIINKDEDFYKLNYLNREWNRVPPATINPAASYTFADESQTLFAMIIAEEVEIGIENAFKFALQNAEKNIGSSPEVINAEWVKVSDSEMINAQYSIDMNGLKFTFNSLFFSSEKGTIQFMTWTFSNIFDEKREILDNILAGLKIK